jgi:hypothetical protein
MRGRRCLPVCLGFHTKYVSFLAAILLWGSVFDTQAQQKQATTKYTPPVWQRKVVRTISLCDTGKAGEQMKLLEKQGKLFSKLLIQQAEKNTLTAWPDSRLDTPLPASQIRAMVTVPPTITISDSGGPAYQVLKIAPNEFNFRIRSYKIMEEWSYDTYSGKTTIRMIAIAPLQDKYGEDGMYRGSKALFWVKWAAISDLVVSCGKYDTVNHIARLVWEDYFKDENMKNEYVAEENYRTKTGWRKTAIQSTILRQWYPFDRFTDSYEAHLDHDATGAGTWSGLSYQDSTLANIIYVGVAGGGIKAYRNPEFKEAAEKVHRMDPVQGADVAELVPERSRMDPAKFLSVPLGMDELKYMTKDEIIWALDPVYSEDPAKEYHKQFSFQDYFHFAVLESWELNVAAGLTEINYKGVAPLQMPQDNGSRSISLPMFWVKYADVKDVQNMHKDYDVQSSLEWNLWTDRFRQKKR